MGSSDQQMMPQGGAPMPMQQPQMPSAYPPGGGMIMPGPPQAGSAPSMRPPMAGGKGGENPLAMLLGGLGGGRRHQMQQWQMAMQEREFQRAQEMDQYKRSRDTVAAQEELAGRQTVGRTLTGIAAEPDINGPMGDLQKTMRLAKKYNPDIVNHPEAAMMVFEAFKPTFKTDSQERLTDARLAGQAEGRAETARHHEVAEGETAQHHQVQEDAATQRINLAKEKFTDESQARWTKINNQLDQWKQKYTQAKSVAEHNASMKELDETYKVMALEVRTSAQLAAAGLTPDAQNEIMRSAKVQMDAMRARIDVIKAHGIPSDGTPEGGEQPRSGTGVAPQPLSSAPAVNEAPKPGDIKKGYRFKGGDPSDKKNWELYQGTQ